MSAGAGRGVPRGGVPPEVSQISEGAPVARREGSGAVPSALCLAVEVEHWELRLKLGHSRGAGAGGAIAGLASTGKREAAHANRSPWSDGAPPRDVQLAL